jgi:hypothetical protein
MASSARFEYHAAEIIDWIHAAIVFMFCRDVELYLPTSLRRCVCCHTTHDQHLELVPRQCPVHNGHQAQALGFLQCSISA